MFRVASAVARRAIVSCAPANVSRNVARVALPSVSCGAWNTAVSVRSYHDNIVDHYENPRNVGSLDKERDDVGTGIVGAPACGDVVKFQILVEDGKIKDVKFKTFGCGSAIAASSVATEWIQGKTLDEAVQVKNSDIASHLKLPPVKLHCSMLAEDAIKAAVQDYKSKVTESA